MDISPGDLEKVYDNVTGTNCVRLGWSRRLQNSSKTGWNNAKWFPSHSMSVPE